MNTHGKAGQKSRSPRKSKRRPLFWLGLALGALALSTASYRIFIRYGASDVTQAETIVYGMLLFIAAIAIFAFLTVLVFKLMKRIFGRSDSFLDVSED